MAFTEEEEQGLRAMLKIFKTQAPSLLEDAAIIASGIYPKFDPNGHKYVTGERFTDDDGTLYTVLQDHTSQSDWTPQNSPSLYQKVLVEEEGQIIEWSPLPAGSSGFSKGQIVTKDGRTYRSLVDHNVWEPGAVGTETVWEDITEEA